MIKEKNTQHESKLQAMEVTAGVIRHEGKILLCQRPFRKNLGGKWEFPGGKLEKGESLPECLARELMEELGVTIENIRSLTTIDSVLPDGRPLHVHFFTCALAGNLPQKKEHEALQWVDPEDLDGFDFCPSDAAVISKCSPLELLG